MATQVINILSLTQIPCSLALSPSSPILKKSSAPGGNLRQKVDGRVQTQLKVAGKEPEVSRRSGNYQPSVWDYNLFQSYTSDYSIHVVNTQILLAYLEKADSSLGTVHLFLDEKQMKQIKRLKDDVNGLFGAVMDPLAKLELIDSIQMLGLEYHFEEEIKAALDSLYHQDAQHPSWINADLYTTALKFRLFRQKGLVVSEDVFKSFKEKYGELKKTLHEDVKVLLSLYEASFLGYEDEATIDEIKTYAATNLKHLSQESSLSDYWVKVVDHALDTPLHWRINRLEAKWYIDVYEQETDMNPSLLQLAKLDFNIVQSTYLQEVQELIRWWLDMGLNNITFSRDRILETYIWIAAMIHEPQFPDIRIEQTKFTSLITMVDDVYDVYGSLEELELVTDIVNRWDIFRVDELPPPVRTVLLAMFNTSNKIGHMCIKNHSFNAIPFISNAWANLCKAGMQEARWYHEGYTPTLDQYLSNSIVSISGPLVLSVFYILSTEKVTKEALEYIQDVQCIVRCSSMIFRLTNDLGTSKDELARGDTKKAVECYMKEAEVGEETAREHITELVNKTWKMMNKAKTGSYPFGEHFLKASENLARMSQYVYKNGDGYGINPGDETRERVMSLLLIPVPLD